MNWKLVYLVVEIEVRIEPFENGREFARVY